MDGYLLAENMSNINNVFEVKQSYDIVAIDCNIDDTNR